MNFNPLVNYVSYTISYQTEGRYTERLLQRVTPYLHTFIHTSTLRFSQRKCSNIWAWKWGEETTAYNSSYCFYVDKLSHEKWRFWRLKNDFSKQHPISIQETTCLLVVKMPFSPKMGWIHGNSPSSAIIKSMR